MQFCSQAAAPPVPALPPVPAVVDVVVAVVVVVVLVPPVPVPVEEVLEPQAISSAAGVVSRRRLRRERDMGRFLSGEGAARVSPGRARGRAGSRSVLAPIATKRYRLNR
jgi:hypothetical protein